MSCNERISRLERESRAWRFAAFVLMFATVGAMACSKAAKVDAPGNIVDPTVDAAEVVDIVRAKEFHLVDPSGAVVGRLHATPSGSALVLDAPDSIHRVLVTPYAILLKNDNVGDLGLSSAGIRLTQLTPAGRTARRVPLADSQSSNDDNQETEKAVMSLLRAKETGGGVIDLFNALGNIAVSIQANKENNGAVLTHDVAGNLVDILGK